MVPVTARLPVKNCLGKYSTSLEKTVVCRYYAMFTNLSVYVRIQSFILKGSIIHICMFSMKSDSHIIHTVIINTNTLDKRPEQYYIQWINGLMKT